MSQPDTSLVPSAPPSRPSGKGKAPLKNSNGTGLMSNVRRDGKAVRNDQSQLPLARIPENRPLSFHDSPAIGGHDNAVRGGSRGCYLHSYDNAGGFTRRRPQSGVKSARSRMGKLSTLAQAPKNRAGAPSIEQAPSVPRIAGPTAGASQKKASASDSIF